MSLEISHNTSPRLFDFKTLCLALMAVFLTWGCASPKGSSKDEQREYIRAETGVILEQVLTLQPELRTTIKEVPGYGVFTYRVTKLPLIPLLGFGGGGGFGVITDNATDQENFMKVRKAEWGWGMGVREIGLVIVFDDERVMQDFIEGKRQFLAGAEATVKAGDAGGGVGATTQGAGWTGYVLSQSGVSYGLTVRTRKYSPNKAL